MAEPSKSVTQLLGETIRELREKKKLSQQQLADLAGLDRSFVNGVENGIHSPTAVTLVKLAIALGLLPTAFFKKFDKATLQSIELE